MGSGIIPPIHTGILSGVIIQVLFKQFSWSISLTYLEDTVLVFRLSEYSAFSSAMFPKP